MGSFGMIYDWGPLLSLGLGIQRGGHGLKKTNAAGHLGEAWRRPCFRSVKKSIPSTFGMKVGIKKK